ncbi:MULTISPECIES: hypothetical protein [Arthrobacter]|uniref:Lipoprotein n=2 Tax=Arthrobacter TaxID=1663 RepID=A0ABU9KN14_9MICC|nr:hypothetical protein [Arthrobacter sp. YJM1]MDP5227567.1 hypothetical protein [Arthrobacter sp. YJM1]
MTTARSFTTRALALSGAVLLLGAAGGCAQRSTVGQADVPSWQATALPADPQAALSGSGKLLDRNPAEAGHGTVAAGRYTITMTCEGNGKVFFELFSGDKSVGDATNACNGNKDRVDLSLPAGPLTVKASSVDVPTLYAFSLAPKS